MGLRIEERQVFVIVGDGYERAFESRADATAHVERLAVLDEAPNELREWLRRHVDQYQLSPDRSRGLLADLAAGRTTVDQIDTVLVGQHFTLGLDLP